MLSFLPSPIILVLSLSFYTLNTLFWVLPIVVVSILKALIPLKFWRVFTSKLLDKMASSWITINTLNQKLFNNIQLNCTGLDNLTMKDWYLVICNHQSWVDILVLQRVLAGHIPFLKFFLKQQLLYVPVLGIAWWALDFPFMRRYSQSFLKKNPHLKGKDIETTKKACEKFKHKPVSVMNFIEGTRFTKEKHQKQNSPFQYLLRPKAGGMAFVLSTMGEQLTKIVDVTIHYPNGIPTFFDYISGKVKQVNVAVRTLPINNNMIGDYVNDRQFKKQFQQWLNQLWQEKDQQLIEFNLISNK